MYAQAKKRKNAPIQREGSEGFPDGLNTLAHGSTLKTSELSELINGIYSQYGTISKRQGTKIIGDSSDGGSEINQLVASYKVGGTDRFIRISDTGVPETFNFNTVAWSDLSADEPDGYSGDNPTFTDGVPTFDTTTTTWIAQTSSRLYFANEVNGLVWLDDDGWHIYATIANPTEYPTVAKTGSGTGSTKFFYQYVWYNEAGGTLASPPADVEVQAEGTGWIDDMPLVLDDDTYLTITLPEAPEGAVTTAIFKGNRQGVVFFLDSVEADDDTYVDKGELGTDTYYGVPDSNFTGGFHFSLLDVYRGSLIGVTTEYGSDTLVWSGIAALGHSHSFSLVDGAGFFPYRQGDGTSINAIKAHVASNDDSLFIFKNNVFGKFSFENEEAGGIIQDVNISVGSISAFSPHVAGNNLRFWSIDGAATVGNEAQYGTILRYSVLSLKADSIVQQVTAANVNQVCGVFFKSLSIFGISTGASGTGNNAALVYDERYNAWSLWTGVYPKVFAKQIDSTNQVEKLFYGSSKTADVLEMFTGKLDYKTTAGTGTKINLSLSTGQYDMGLPDQFKKFDKVVLVFGSLTGNNTSVGIFRADHTGITNDPRLIISQEALLSGFGNDEWGNQEVGMMGEEDAGSTVNLRYIDLKQKDLFWIKVNIQNDGTADELSIIGIYVYYAESSRPLTFGMKLTDLA